MLSPGILSPVSSPCNESVTSSDSDVISTDSPPPDSHLDNFTCPKIRILLETKPEQYIILKNTGKHTSDCWNYFGFPAIVNPDGKPKRIQGFVSCQHCFTTYSFISNSTRLLNRHKCKNSMANEVATQNRLTVLFNHKPSKLKDNEILKIKNLQVKWICQNIRPFSIMEDDGLRQLIQECISIGMRFNKL